MTLPIVIVGAGLAGLSCAQHLRREGRSFVIVEASDAPGGRVRTDVVDGFRLDRGFQVLLDSYPSARAQLDLAALRLQPFKAGAMVRFDGRFHRVGDPFRHPIDGVRSLITPIGSLADKLRIARLRATIGRRRDETTTLELLRGEGFSDAVIDRFFRPFFGGVFLDPMLATSSRMFQFVFRIFARGSACLPAGGMGAIARQMASQLPDSSIRLNSAVEAIERDGVRLAGGERIGAAAVVVATDAPAAARLLKQPVNTRARATTCLYFAADRAPINEPILLLNGDGVGPINHLCVPSVVAPGYAPAGRHLVSVSVFDDRDDDDLRHAVLTQCADWFGEQARSWRHLRTYRIPYALPDQRPPLRTRSPLEGGVLVCGDWCEHGSIEGALASGRRAAGAITAPDQRLTA